MCKPVLQKELSVGKCDSTVTSLPSDCVRNKLIIALGTLLCSTDFFFSPKRTFSRKEFSSVQLLGCVRHFGTPWTAARQASLSITNSWILLKHMSIVSVMPTNHLILCYPFSSHLQSFPASGSFQMSQLFASVGQSIGVSASASVLPMKIQD